MNQETLSHTLPLFTEREPVPDPPPAISPRKELALALTENDWLKFLADEWWPSAPLVEPLLLGYGTPIVSTEADTAEVIVWIDTDALAQVKLSAYREAGWVTLLPGELEVQDTAVAWHGPVPLFAVRRFTLKTQERVAHMTGLTQSFANLEPVSQPTTALDVQPMTFTERLPKLRKKLPLNGHWDALRGAAAMALWSVPAIAPWQDALCFLLNKPAKPSRNKKLPDIDVPWLLDTPWRYLGIGRASNDNGHQSIMWRAVLSVIAKAEARRDWRPKLIVEAICAEASHNGLPSHLLDSYLRETHELLDDLKTVDIAREKFDPVGLALQLVLLRPEPGNFMSWRSDLPLSPAVIWTGAMLSGLLQGFRDLENRFKGTRDNRRLMDLLMWSRTTAQPMKWPGTPTDSVTWQRVGQRAQLFYGDTLWNERNFGQRGQWYEADLQHSGIEAQAIKIAERYAPEVLSTYIRLSDTRIPQQGSGRLSTNAASKELIVKGEVFVLLPADTKLETGLDHRKFKKWIATASLIQRLPKLESGLSGLLAESAAPLPILVKTPISGLYKLENFITPDQERALVAAVDASEWSNELKRRVQHYGWKYNYKSRAIAQSDYLGPLPDWADELAQRLYDLGHVPERPDQVIVNEYQSDQGISKHIDCTDCFRGPIVTLSLLESWHMTFRLKREKFELLLPCRSATVIDGAARHLWTHEIPQRKSENDVPRIRRISLTFRKVNNQTH